MKSFPLICSLTLTALFPLVSQAAASEPLAGRWDLTITTPTETYPSWLEVQFTNGVPKVRVQGKVSSVHPANDVKLDGTSHMSFATSEWFGKQIPVTWDLTVADGKLTGVQKRPDMTGQIVAVPAPLLNRAAPKAWTKPEPLFNGKNLDGWVPDDPAFNHWTVIDGDLVNVKPGANLQSTRKVQDFKLHIEFNCPDEGNSGIYLRGRYEIQVAYQKENDAIHGMGAVYGFLAPEKEIAPKPGAWETFDVTLIGRHVTIVRNGIKIVNNREIPGITGGALDSAEAEPAPIFLQGDHTGGMKYRNITIEVPKE